MAHDTPSSKGKGKEKTYFCWTPEMDKVLGACFIEEMNRGNKQGGKCAWKSTSWMAAVNALNEKLKVNIDKAKIINRLKTWGKHYDNLHPLLVSNNSVSPITWDPAKGRIEIHDESVWRERLEANSKLRAYREGKIIVNNWDDICTLFSQDHESGQGAQPDREACVGAEIDSCNSQRPCETDQRAVEEDDAMSTSMARQEHLENEHMSTSMARQERLENIPSSDSRGMKRKHSSSELLEGLRRFLMAESRRATTKEVLKELDTVDLDITQKLRALDMMMQNQRLFETFSGLPDHLRLPWVLMHLKD